MRVAVDGVYFGLSPKRGPEELIALTREVGADGLNWPFHADYGADDPAGMAAKLREAGLAVVSLGLTRHISAIPGEEASFREDVARGAAAAQIYGTWVLDCWPYRPAELDKATAQEVLAANLRAVAPILQEAGCVLSMEFEPGATVERFGEARDFVAGIGPEARLTADTYHIIRIGDDLAQAATALGPHIGIVHFSASNRGEPGTAEDKCDYVAFLKAALKAGFVGDLVLQYAPPAETAESLKRAVALTRRVIAECAG